MAVRGWWWTGWFVSTQSSSFLSTEKFCLLLIGFMCFLHGVFLIQSYCMQCEDGGWFIIQTLRFWPLWGCFSCKLNQGNFGLMGLPSIYTPTKYFQWLLTLYILYILSSDKSRVSKSKFIFSGLNVATKTIANSAQ